MNPTCTFPNCDCAVKCDEDGEPQPLEVKAVQHPESEELYHWINQEMFRDIGEGC